ncbi:MAG: PIG-L family deacetylase [Armatimonadetes bacterium]|nr:PIG-L family deacetylase [Armatimonadota bacterium]
MKGRRLARFILMTFLLGLIWWGSASARLIYRIHEDNREEETLGLPLFPPPAKSDRILFFSPHCDDETLAAGGYLYEAARAGAQVRVVMLTNGDGFRFALERELGELRLKPEDYIAFAHRRQREAVEAVRSLGISEENILFLGYPDRGLAALWTRNWGMNDLFRSPYTRRTTSPYADSYRPQAPYCGQALTEDIASIIRDFRPTRLFMPHPNDDHPDHWAASCFVRTALTQVKADSGIDIRTYLVHRGDWPVPQGLNASHPLAPPARLVGLDTRWSYRPIGEEAVIAKYRATQRYKSQMAVMKRFMLSFTRSGEVFGSSPAAALARVSEGAIKIDGDRSDWYGIQAVILDPVQDNLARGWEGSADIQRVFAARDRDFLYLRADMRKSFSRRVQYRFRLRSLEKGLEECQVFTVGAPKGTNPSGLRYAWRANVLEVAIPRNWIAPSDTLFISSDTAAFGRLPVDRTAWKLMTSRLPTP